MTSPSARGRRARRLVLLPVVTVLVAGVLAANAFLGGFEEAVPAPESLGKGAEVDQGRMRTRFVDAVVRVGGHDGIGISDKRYLEIVLSVTNQSDRTISAYTMDNVLPTVRADGEVIKPKDPSEGLGPRFVVSVPGHAYDQLHPGVPSTVIMAFELAEGERAPKSVRIDTGTYVWRETFFAETYEWTMVMEEKPPTKEDVAKGRTGRWEPVVTARVDLPVRSVDA
ncbi:hypothetical protein [Sphaerisporangium aureirubrum]|uniref:DUF4352 domain-containing protein n=1 Tax=Sphaerisporangium aureirubrum TaxID=1544736 RepID=A0ABW1N9Y1_9ACTN